MKFFIPFAEDEQQAERVYDLILKSIGATSPRRRVRRIDYVHNGIAMIAEVGQPIHSYYRESGPVIAIVPSNQCHCVCLPTRGVAGGSPIYVGDSTIQRTEYFEE
jgi:hypothetical protein